MRLDCAGLALFPMLEKYTEYVKYAEYQTSIKMCHMYFKILICNIYVKYKQYVKYVKYTEYVRYTEYVKYGKYVI